MKYNNYYLDLNKIIKLKSKREREQIHRYYMDMMHCFIDKRTEMAISIFNTLNQAGYLKEIRSEKIEKILND